jgi:hypothetical protein
MHSCLERPDGMSGRSGVRLPFSPEAQKSLNLDELGIIQGQYFEEKIFKVLSVPFVCF